MVYRKGELTNSAIDRGWPHQVALPAERTYGEAYVAARLFADSLSLCPRGHAFSRNGQWFNVWCFANREDAEKLMQKFGGEIIAPKDRPKWPG